MPRPTTLVYWARTTNLLCFHRDINAIAGNFKNWFTMANALGGLFKLPYFAPRKPIYFVYGF
jgi:hypothetical protein